MPACIRARRLGRHGIAARSRRIAFRGSGGNDGKSFIPSWTAIIIAAAVRKSRGGCDDRGFAGGGCPKLTLHWPEERKHTTNPISIGALNFLPRLCVWTSGQ